MLRWVLILLALTLTLSCRQNQKEEVKELETREAETRSEVIKDDRQTFETEMDRKLTSVRLKIDEARRTVQEASSRLPKYEIDSLGKKLDGMESDYTSLRVRLDELKGLSNEEFADKKHAVETSIVDLERDWNRFADLNSH